jgi:hypothetical protein
LPLSDDPFEDPAARARMAGLLGRTVGARLDLERWSSACLRSTA